MNNDTPFKLRALRALTAAIKEVTPENGYVSNLADFDPGDGAPMERVVRGRAWFGDESPLPMISVLEHVDESAGLFPTPPDDSTTGYEWEILVQGFVADDAMHPTDPAYALMRDVRRRLVRERKRPKSAMSHTTDPLGSSQWNLPGCRITDMRVSTGKVRPADDISSRAYFWMVVTLTVIEDAEEA